ncbi:M3 family metallopeptidase [Amycolatopsis acidiphila]|uniref:M3 family metallopeptidase n=1 Tax=Amycolatopsis acidiphila TaxID=715473 RepID=A0A558A9K8_9PSEU|nr:M3 family metallopeptidase [Amycolatopsis acidiphila]TVT20934.1 M3 family metallopeptidase [Amycolatopsis acidiphila]UIJ62966.1 M3 family metallopeptidase [Amycolatopsis acidiphila]GHG65336.1 peptidyl-dipeptidase Dcp [Amycolatopsis acidiphila]
MNSQLSPDNPFAKPSELPYGLPPFDRIRDEHHAAAFEAGLAEHAAEVEAIAANPEPATFDNTVVALERSGSLLTRVSSVFFNLTSSDTNPALQDLQAEIAPKLAAHHDAIHLDPRLYARVRELFDNRAALGLDEESAWLLERVHTDFRRAGAGLPEADQARLRELNGELSTLSTRFQENLLRDTNDLAVVVDDASELAGLSADAVAAAREAANSRGEQDRYLLSLNLPTSQPLLASLENRALRERLFRASTARGNRGNDNDNSAVLTRIAALRAERAALLGYPHHAAYVISDETARTSEAAVGLLERLAPAAVANAKRDAEELQRYLEQDIPGATLEPWDWAFYGERVRKARYDIDEATLRPYFELDRVLRDGVFFAANQLYGLSFTERHDLPTYHPEVRVFEVFDADGSPLGLFLGDYYTRDSKRGGAWMNTFADQSYLLGGRPVVVNNLNISRPPEGEPTLLTFDEVVTAFHEFGHALHALMSAVRYPAFSGTNVPRDFVEYPSQVNEMWMLWPQVLANYAKHHETGEPLPQRLVERLQESAQYGQGHATTEYLAAALLDQAWHGISADDDIDDVARFEAAALEKAGVALRVVPPRYRSTYFAHVFSGGYSAGYYSYIWSEVLDADTVEWFHENGGLTRANGDHFRSTLLSRGGSTDSMAAFRTFRGRDPEITPLLTRRGLTGA